MSSLAQISTRVTIAGDPPLSLPVVDGQISMNDEWMPYIQGDLTCAYTPDVEDLDPQAKDIWVTITVNRSRGRTDRIRDISLRYAGKTLAAITSEFAGRTIAAITRSLYHDYDTPGAARRDEVRTFRLMLREVTIDHAAATVTLKLASGEARLTDWDHMGPNTDREPGANLVAKINHMLALAGFPAGLASYPSSVPTDAQIGDEALRTPGQSALDWLQQITRKHDLMAWCDEAGLWRLATTRTKPATRRLTSLGDDRTIINMREVRSRDAGWVTAVMLIYTWNGVTYYDIAYPGAPNPEKARVVRYETPFPGTGRAARMLAQLRPRGKSLTVVAVSEPLITPGETVTTTTATGTRSGRCASVTWRLAADQMTITLREVA